MNILKHFILLFFIFSCSAQKLNRTYSSNDSHDIKRMVIYQYGNEEKKNKYSQDFIVIDRVGISRFKKTYFSRCQTSDAGKLNKQVMEHNLKKIEDICAMTSWAMGNSKGYSNDDLIRLISIIEKHQLHSCSTEINKLCLSALATYLALFILASSFVPMSYELKMKILKVTVTIFLAWAVKIQNAYEFFKKPFKEIKRHLEDIVYNEYSGTIIVKALDINHTIKILEDILGELEQEEDLK